jgi:transcriptional regulator with XRE-family HTH domain
MINERLKLAMMERNITQKELAAATGFAKSGISQYISGKARPSPKACAKLAAVLEVDPEYFTDPKPVTAEPMDAIPVSALKNISIKDAAEMMGKSEQFVRVALQRGKAPFGFATQMSGKSYHYHISPKKFYEYMGVV